MPELPQAELLASSAQMSDAPFPFSGLLDSGMVLQSEILVFGIEMKAVDIALLVLCPIFSVLGILVASLLSNYSSSVNSHFFNRFFKGFFSNLANILIGLSVGLVISLFFIGAINNDMTSLARVLVLSIFIGYKTPLAVSFSQNSFGPQYNTKPNHIKVSLDQDAIKQEKIKQARLTNAPDVSIV